MDIRPPPNVINHPSPFAAPIEAASGIQANDIELGRFDPATTLIRIDSLLALTGFGRATIYKLMRHPESGFPKAVKLTDSTARGAPVAWVLSEVQDWIKSRIAARKE